MDLSKPYYLGKKLTCFLESSKMLAFFYLGSRSYYKQIEEMINIVFSILSISDLNFLSFIYIFLYFIFLFPFFSPYLAFVFCHTCSSISSFQLRTTILQLVLLAEPLQMHHIAEILLQEIRKTECSLSFLEANVRSIKAVCQPGSDKNIRPVLGMEHIPYKYSDEAFKILFID